jgi:hypothetical protein
MSAIDVRTLPARRERAQREPWVAWSDLNGREKGGVLVPAAGLVVCVAFLVAVLVIALGS